MTTKNMSEYVRNVRIIIKQVVSLPKNKHLLQFFLIQSSIQMSHKLNWFGLKREELMTIFFKTTSKIATKMIVGNCSLSKSND